MLGLALVVDLDDRCEQVTRARLAVGSVSPTPRRSAAAENLLTGEVGEAAGRLDQAADALADDAALVDDLEGLADYKRHLIHVFLERAWKQALSTTA
jgi:carbon-monoxide dehydrogenase medium subunit